jgi:hypothetical protein
MEENKTEIEMKENKTEIEVGFVKKETGGVCTIATTFTPGMVDLDEIAQLETGLQLAETALVGEYKVFRNYNPLPVEFKSASGIRAGYITNLVHSLFRTIDPQTGIQICYQTVNFLKTSDGWNCAYTGAPNMEVMCLNASGGVVDVAWQAAAELWFDCRDRNVFMTYRQQFRPDFYDFVATSMICFGSGRWYRC